MQIKLRPDREPDLSWPKEFGFEKVEMWVDENIVFTNGHYSNFKKYGADTVLKLIERSAKLNMSKSRRESSLNFLMERELLDL